MSVDQDKTYWVILDKRGDVLSRNDEASQIHKRVAWLFGSETGAKRMLERAEGETLARVRLEFCGE